MCLYTFYFLQRYKDVRSRKLIFLPSNDVLLVAVNKTESAENIMEENVVRESIREFLCLPLPLPLPPPFLFRRSVWTMKTCSTNGALLQYVDYRIYTCILCIMYITTISDTVSTEVDMNSGAGENSCTDMNSIINA